MLQDSRTNSSSCPTSDIVTTMSNNNTTTISETSSVPRTHSRRMTGNGCSRRSDRNYGLGLSSDIFVTDFDDERTLDEEEAMEGSEDSHNELTNLQKEGDMPLKELLAKYGYSHTSTENSNSSDQLHLIRNTDESRNDVNLTGKMGDVGNDFEDDDEEEDEEDDEEDDEDDEEEEDDNDDDDDDDDEDENGGDDDGDDNDDDNGDGDDDGEDNDDDNDEDDDDDEEDDEEDEDNNGENRPRIKQKIKNYSQPNLRQFYTEMVEKKKKKRNRLNTKNQKVKTLVELESNDTEKRVNDGNIFQVSYGDNNKKVDNKNENVSNNTTIGCVLEGEKLVQDDDNNININIKNNSNTVVDGNERIIRRTDEVEDEDEDDEEDDDDDEYIETRGAIEDVEISCVVSGGNVVGTGDVGVGGGGGGGGGGGSSRLLRSVSRPQSEEEDDDCDYSPDEEEWKKTIMVGSDYQATIPEGLCRYDDALPYENEDKILWNPIFITEEETEEFLERAQMPITKGNTSLPIGSHIRDDEQALYLLLQCGYNLDEALRRRRMNVLPPTDAISLWSEEECHNFESGLRTYGKDFHLIQKNKVRTRSVGELVQFYYLWKKTERHDIFTYKARLEKKKYALHPGITDYMDRFLEEQEGVRDRSSSPNVNNYLIHADAKRQRTSINNITNSHCESGKSWDDGTNNEDSLGDVNNITGMDTVSIAEVAPPLPPPTTSSLLPPPAPPPFISTSNSTATLTNNNNFPTPTTISQVNSTTTTPTSISTSTSSASSNSIDYSSSTENNLSHLPT